MGKKTNPEKYARRRRGQTKAAMSQRLRRKREKEKNASERERKQVVCCVFGCNEKFKIGSNIGFFKFPTCTFRRDLWIRAVKRMNWSPSSTSVVCGKHFQKGKPTAIRAHPDYVPNVFVATDSVAKPSSHSSAVQIEESWYRIADRNETGDMHSDSQLSSSFIDISEGTPSKNTSHHPVVPNSFAFTNSVERHRGHRSTAQTGESQCVIYDKIEIEDVPTDPELSSPSTDISETHTTGKKSKVVRTGTETQQTTEGVAVKREVDEPLIPDAAEIVYESSTTDKEKELSKLRKELQEAHKRIRSLESEKKALQNYVTDRIFLDASKLRFFTGLNSNRDFQSLTKLLHDVDTTSVTVSMQLLIVLMRLQLNLKYPDLADRFQTSVNTIRKICETVIPHLESKLKSFLEGLLPITLGVQPNVSYCKKNAVFEKLYSTIQRYNKSMHNVCTNQRFTNKSGL